jgi:hypothetical protein
LLCEHSHKSSAETTELILLDELVKVDTQQLENKAQVLTMDESILQTEEMVIIMLIELAI